MSECCCHCEALPPCLDLRPHAHNVIHPSLAQHLPALQVSRCATACHLPGTTKSEQCASVRHHIQQAWTVLAQAARAYLCDLTLLTSPCAPQLLPCAATVLTLWPGLLGGGRAQAAELEGMLHATLHDLCLPGRQPEPVPGPAGLPAEDSATLGSWSGSTMQPGRGGRVGSLTAAARRELGRLGALHWGWPPSPSQLLASQQEQEQEQEQQAWVPQQCSALLAHLQQQLPSADQPAAWAALGCALAMASLAQGWQWAMDEVRHSAASCTMQPPHACCCSRPLQALLPAWSIPLGLHTPAPALALMPLGCASIRACQRA